MYSHLPCVYKKQFLDSNRDETLGLLISTFTYRYVHMYMCTFSAHLLVCIYFTCEHLHLNARKYIFTCTYVNLHVLTNIYMHTSTLTHIYVNVHMYLHMYICIRRFKCLQFYPAYGRFYISTILKQLLKQL